MAKDPKAAAKPAKASAAKADAPKASTAKASTAKATTAKAGTAKAAAGTKKVNPALMKPMTPSKELGAVVGTSPLPRTEVVSKVWDYIKSNKLQNPKNGREILADDKLKKVFGTDKVTMFEMNKHLSKHLS